MARTCDIRIYTIGLFLIDALNQAIVGLGPNDYDPVVKLQELMVDEDKDYDTFFQSTLQGLLRRHHH
jgi:hypothetical protein